MTIMDGEAMVMNIMAEGIMVITASTTIHNRKWTITMLNPRFSTIHNHPSVIIRNHTSSIIHNSLNDIKTRAQREAWRVVS